MAKTNKNIRGWGSPSRYFQGPGLMRKLSEYTGIFGKNAYAIIDQFFFDRSSDMQYLQWKAKRVYDDYHAFIMIVDSRGRVMDNLAFLTRNSDNALETLDGDGVSHLLMDWRDTPTCSASCS